MEGVGGRKVERKISLCSVWDESERGKGDCLFFFIRNVITNAEIYLLFRLIDSLT